MANLTVMGMAMDTGMGMATAILKMKKEKNGGSFGNKFFVLIVLLFPNLLKSNYEL